MDIQEKIRKLAEVDITILNEIERNKYVRSLNEILDKEPNNIDCLFLKALYYESIDENETALKFLETVQDIDSNGDFNCYVQDAISRIRAQGYHCSDRGNKHYNLDMENCTKVNIKTLLFFKIVILILLLLYLFYSLNTQ